MHKYGVNSKKESYAILCSLIMVDHFKCVWLDQELSGNSISWNKKKKEKWKKNNNCKNVYESSVYVDYFHFMPFIKSQKIWKRKKGFLQLHVGEFEENDVKNFSHLSKFSPKEKSCKICFSLNTTKRLFNLYLHLTNIVSIVCHLNFVCVTIWYLFPFYFPCFP